MDCDNGVGMLHRKIKTLDDVLGRCHALGVAFSGGVDSTVLLAAARRILGDRVVAFTAQSIIHPIGEDALAVEMARNMDVRHILMATHELDMPQFTANGRGRCYHCKRHLFHAIQSRAAQEGIQVIAHGANVDDLSDFRPGFKAAQEMGVIAPLIDAGLTKTEVRQLARHWGLSNWDRPAMACLASRIPYGTPITPDVVQQIGKAEAVLRRICGDPCRVRHHGNVARIEAGTDLFHRLLNPGPRRRIVQALRELGYDHVCLDLEGYVPGKMNRGAVP